MRRLTSTIAALGLLVAAPAAARNPVIPLETPPWFVQVVGGYAHRVTEQGSAFASGQQLTIFEQTLRPWNVGGHVTVPFASQFGARLRVDGGSTRLSQGGLRSEIGEVTGQGELFWRDPTKGQVGAGYGYGWASPRTPSAVRSITTHRIPVFASLYMPELDGGTVDWNASFTYDFLSLQTATGSTSQWSYDVRGGSTWYVNRFASFEAGLRYQRLIAAQQADLLEGTFALALLVPTGGPRHFGTVTLLGAVGRAEQKDLAAPFDTLARLSWQIGAEVTVHFPGVTSLVELNRAYR